MNKHSDNNTRCKWRKLDWLGVCFFTVLISGNTFAEDIQCPRSIAVPESLVSPPKGWEVYNRSMPHMLMAVEFYDGPLSDMASLTPTKEGGTGSKEFAIWHFPNNNGNQWIACNYRNSSIVLSKKLDRSIVECKVHYEREPGQTSPGEIKKITCTSTEEMMK